VAKLSMVVINYIQNCRRSRVKLGAAYLHRDVTALPSAKWVVPKICVGGPPTQIFETIHFTCYEINLEERQLLYNQCRLPRGREGAITPLVRSGQWLPTGNVLWHAE